MATSIELQVLRPISKKRKRSSSLSYGIATPPKSPREAGFVKADIAIANSKAPKDIQHPSPPSSVELSSEPYAPDASTKLLTIIRCLKDDHFMSEGETSISITLAAFLDFEKALKKDRALEKFFRKKLRWEWDSLRCLFRILYPDARAKGICEKITQCCRAKFEQLAEPGYTLEGLDSWERIRVKELLELIRPFSCRTMSIGQSRLSPDLAFTFGTTDSLLGLAQMNKDPLVVFEIQHSKTGDVRGQMEERARLYLGEPRFEGPFRHSVKTVILVYYMQEDDESRKVYIRVSRVKVMDGKRVVITQVVDPSTRTGYVELSLSDFLPQDAIDLGFRENEFGVRACDSVKIDIDITEALRRATGCEQGIQTLDDALPRMVQRRRVDSVRIEE